VPAVGHAQRVAVWNNDPRVGLSHCVGSSPTVKDGSITRGIGAQTFNFYLQAAKQFARWMVRDGRAS